jgi:hypothetical protein
MMYYYTIKLWKGIKQPIIRPNWSKIMSGHPYKILLIS